MASFQNAQSCYLEVGEDGGFLVLLRLRWPSLSRDAVEQCKMGWGGGRVGGETDVEVLEQVGP